MEELLRVIAKYTSSITLIILFMQSYIYAQPIDNTPVMHSSYGRELVLRGEYEKGIGELREAYLLFPLNLTFKRNLAEGYAAYGHRLFKQKRYEQADENYIKALELYPEESGYALLRGICNYHLKKYDVARYELERAKFIRENSIETLYYLGLVQFDTDHRQEAIELWEQALKLSPGRKELIDLLEKARRENAVESTMDHGHSSRFDLTYDPYVNTEFALAVLEVLESAANLIGAELGVFPEARVPVAIYKRSDYKTVTDSPDWSGGFYDGTIRLPFGSLNQITPPIREVLFHEYAHVVVFELTRGNCPLWLNEGIAEMFGRMQHNRPLPEFGKAARTGNLINFRSLEANFNEFTPSSAALAYQQSYALVNYMATTYGWHKIKGILDNLGGGNSFDESISLALKDYNLDYDSMTKEWRNSVEKEMKGK
ncbi:MAG: peptidase MA family metallohydrolase [Desulfuromonadaceae bacterium]|nr:peptidase MA family metallohydrolase [Desulfuromonadaceae bacterium]MDD2854319.1 peptidase MA family metallohydrolase [Desulfuromonadaceae bacterium]